MTLPVPNDVGAPEGGDRLSAKIGIVPAATLRELQSLYDAGLCLKAFDLVKTIGPLETWKGNQARILAGRLAANLGAARLSGIIHWQTWREEKQNPDLIAYRVHALLHRRGPLPALEFLESCGEIDANSEANGRIHYFTVKALIMAAFRDFAESEDALHRAERINSEHSWLATVRAHVYELQDRYSESLQAARQSLKLNPWYRPGVQAVAHALQLLDRDEEALALLGEAATRIENMHVVRELALLQQEHQRFDEAAANLVRFEELAPLMEKGERKWLTRQRVTVDCLRNNFPAALAGAKEVNEPFYQELAARLSSVNPPKGRVRLDVPFVRQHHLTCAPATLTAISAYWKRPAEHLSIAEGICYDGTPAHSERHWAETHGWTAREFTLTWEAAKSLLDRGIPFTLGTSEITTAHLQAVVGYDELRQTLWIRDPFIYYAHEFTIKPLLERYKSTGPRAMAMVPSEQSRLLDDLALPEAELYDQLYCLQRALAQHQRDEALAACREMQAHAPEHRLTLTARRSIASYDTNTPALLECIELLLKQFPDDGNLILTKLSCLRDLARRKERLAILETICAKPGSDPVFWQQYAQELRVDGRQRRAAQSWACWALRYRPADAGCLSLSADILWDNHEFAKANSRYRLAACLGSTREQYSQSFFTAARHLRETERALQFLKERQQRLGSKSSAPTITLVESLRRLGRTGEALEFLRDALARRPDDGSLQLFATDVYGRFSQFDAAAELLSKAKNHSSLVGWHRAAAVLADYRNDKPAALEHWREVLQIEPLAHDAIRASTNLLAEIKGREQAMAFLDELCSRFPFSCPLLGLRAQWAREDGTQAAITYIRKLLEVNPVDAWAWRELAVQLNNIRKFDEAIEAAHEAIRLEPDQSAGYSVRGDILVQNERLSEGQADYREALRLEVDNEYALHHYVQTAPDLAARKQALAVVAEELRRQVIFRNALFAYQQAARGLLPAGQVLELLREAHRVRPDLWQAWSVLINQLVDMGKSEEALELAKQAAGGFPLLPRLWVDLARVHQARLDSAAEAAALEKALELSPGYAYASRQLAGVYERADDLAKARSVLEQAIAANPLEPDNHGYLAHIFWKLKEKDAAITRVRHVLQLQPGNSWSWKALREWGNETGQPDLAADVARDLTRSRAGEARSWLMLARSLPPQSASEEIFLALDKAVALNPRAEDAYDIRARVLAELNRFDEALAVCNAAALQPTPPKLKIRAAWVEAQRGNLSRGIALARAALAEHPDHYGGWQLLAEWHEKSNQLEQAVDAAEKMAALAPLEAVPLGYLADLKSRLGDKSGAKAAFQRAFTLDPDYQYAGFHLFHLQLGEQEYKNAASTLSKLSRHGETHQTLACQVELVAAQKKLEAAFDSFKKLCSQLETESWSLTSAAKALDKNGQRKQVDAILDTQLNAENCATAVAELWVKRQISHKNWKLHKRLDSLLSKGELGRKAIFCYLDQLGEAASKAKNGNDIITSWWIRFNLWRVLRKHRNWLATDVIGWGKVGYVLTCMGRPRPAVAWLGDWKQRPKAESWMLYNLVIMLQQLGRYEGCRDIIRHAVTLRHEEKLYEVFRLWAAFEEALAGNVSASEQHLATLSRENIKEQFRPAEIMTRLLIRLAGVPPAEKKAFFKNVRAELQSAFAKTRPSKSTRYVRDGYRRFIAELCDQGGGTQLRLWGWWFYGQKNLLLPLLSLLLIPAALVFPPILGLALVVMMVKVISRR